jgi:hypothetical protein
MAAISPYLSRMFYGTKPAVRADGQKTIAVKIRVRDVNDQPLVGHRVTLFADHLSAEISQPYLTDERGYAVGLVSCSAEAFVTITAEVSAMPEESSVLS